MLPKKETQYYPERFAVRCLHYAKIKMIWEQCYNPKDFETSVEEYIERVENEVLLPLEKQLPRGKNEEKFKADSRVYTYIFAKIGMYQVAAESLFDEYPVESLFGEALIDARQRYLSNREYNDFLMAGDSGDVSAYRTEVLSRIITYVYRRSGEKMYFVSPGLEYELRHTELRKLPVEFLTLPYEVIYLVLPDRNPFRVYHELTGWHEVEGMYLAEHNSTPRMLRVYMVGKPNGSSVNVWDDASFHWAVYLDEGKTLDECINYAVDIIQGAKKATRTVSRVDGSTFEISMSTNNKGCADFMHQKTELIAALKYAVNVVLYASHPDAETCIFNESDLYAKLRQRALKAVGPKRKMLLARAQNERGKDRMLLGASVTVNRVAAFAENSVSNRVGKPLTVRTYVAGHWQHYWVGPMKGPRMRAYKRKRPYWKGPKEGPVIVKQVHVLC